MTKGLVAELAPPHVRSVWGSRGKMVRAAGLVACCNYFSKKKKDVNDKLRYIIKSNGSKTKQHTM